MPLMYPHQKVNGYHHPSMFPPPSGFIPTIPNDKFRMGGAFQEYKKNSPSTNDQESNSAVVVVPTKKRVDLKDAIKNVLPEKLVQ